MTTINDLDDFKALEPFFRIIEQGLDGLADGEHFFDLLAEDVVFDYIITIPGYPRHLEGLQPSQSYTALTATRSSWTGATISLSITTPTPASSCSSTPHKVGSLRPELPTPTGTSQCSRSRIARSLAGVTTRPCRGLRRCWVAFALAGRTALARPRKRKSAACRCSRLPLVPRRA